MAKVGTVVAWRRPFGIVETADGETVRIYTADIDGGRLRVGREAKFDVEEVKEGKFKGVNVTGDAVLLKDQELNEEQIAEDKAHVKAQRKANNDKNSKELEDILALLEKTSRKNKSLVLNKLMKSMNVSKADEKRVDPTQETGKGKTPLKYSRGEFIAFYGKAQGLQLWKDAAPKKKGDKKKANKKKEKTITKE